MSKVTISLRIDEKLHDLLKAASEKCGKSVSEIVRQACIFSLMPPEVPPEHQDPSDATPPSEDLLRRQDVARWLIDEAYAHQEKMGTDEIADLIAEAKRRME